MDEHHKQDQAQRHLRQAARGARRKQREGFASQPDSRQRQSRGAAQEDEGWEDPRPQRASRKQQAKPHRSQPKAAQVEGLVSGVRRGHALVLLEGEGEPHLASLGPQLRQTPLVVGDRVLLRTGDSPRIESLLERRTLLSRPDVGNRHRELPIAANVDVGVIVAAHSSPPLRPGLIDRYLVALERAGIEPLLCINKMDLCLGEKQEVELNALLDPYRELGLGIVFACAQSGVGTEELVTALQGQTAVLVGHSGVGKSSLLQALGADPEGALSGDVREFDGRGRHTTSASTLWSLPSGVRLIDTPGVRAFGLWGIDALELSRDFPGFGELARACPFRDCMHLTEPKCAVREAVACGRLSESRLRIYERMLEELRD